MPPTSSGPSWLMLLREWCVTQARHIWLILFLLWRVLQVGSVAAGRETCAYTRLLARRAGDRVLPRHPPAVIASVASPDPVASPIHTYTPHEHAPRNVNHVHQAEVAASGFNVRLAVWLTAIVSTMPTAYVFTVLAILGLAGLLNLLPPIVFLLATWLSQQFLQLVFLPILSVGQGVMGRRQELQSEEQFQTTQRTAHDIADMMRHLAAQDQVTQSLVERVVELERINHQQLDLLVQLTSSPPITPPITMPVADRSRSL